MQSPSKLISHEELLNWLVKSMCFNLSWSSIDDKLILFKLWLWLLLNTLAPGVVSNGIVSVHVEFWLASSLIWDNSSLLELINFPEFKFSSTFVYMNGQILDDLINIHQFCGQKISKTIIINTLNLIIFNYQNIITNGVNARHNTSIFQCKNTQEPAYTKYRLEE